MESPEVQKAWRKHGCLGAILNNHSITAAATESRIMPLHNGLFQQSAYPAY